MQEAAPVTELYYELEPKFTDYKTSSGSQRLPFNISFGGPGASQANWQVSAARDLMIVTTSESSFDVIAPANFNTSEVKNSVRLSFFDGDRSLIDQHPVLITINQAARPTRAPKPPTMPQALYNHLNGDQLYVIRAKVFIARKGPLSTSVTKNTIRRILTGYTMESVNPMLLRLGVYFDINRTQIAYVELPEDAGGRSDNTLRYPVLDESGNQLRTRDGSQDSTIARHDAHQIYILSRLNAVSNAIGLGIINGSRIWLRADGADSQTLAHELGHNLGLFHTNQSNACEQLSDRHYLMHATRYIGMLQRPNVTECENSIATSRGAHGTRMGIANQRHGEFVSIRALSSATYEEVLEGWDIITNPSKTNSYASSYTVIRNSSTSPQPQDTTSRPSLRPKALNKASLCVLLAQAGKQDTRAT